MIASEGRTLPTAPSPVTTHYIVFCQSMPAQLWCCGVPSKTASRVRRPCLAELFGVKVKFVESRRCEDCEDHARRPAVEVVSRVRLEGELAEV